MEQSRGIRITREHATGGCDGGARKGARPPEKVALICRTRVAPPARGVFGFPGEHPVDARTRGGLEAKPRQLLVAGQPPMDTDTMLCIQKVLHECPESPSAVSSEGRFSLLSSPAGDSGEKHCSKKSVWPKGCEIGQDIILVEAEPPGFVKKRILNSPPPVTQDPPFKGLWAY